LEQQDCKRLLTVGTLEVAALLQHLNGDRRRRQPERNASHECARNGEPEGKG
jgi:hypothetical protein